MAEASFIGHGVNQILAGGEKFFGALVGPHRSEFARRYIVLVQVHSINERIRQ